LGAELRFLGAAREVGRACIELRAEGLSLLLDSGVNLGGKGRDRVPLRPASNPDALLLTHAHLDHSGYSPVVVREYSCRVYATLPTRDLSELLLVDALSHLEGSPDYSNEDVMRLRAVEEPVDVGLEFSIGSIRITPLNAGHVLGSVMYLIELPDGPRVLYTGDVNTANSRTLRGANLSGVEADYLIIESTYGGDGDVHPSRKKIERKFISDIRTVLKSGGKVIIPTFALGRAQEVILTLISYLDSGLLPEVPIFVDGMIREVNRLYSLYWTWLRPELQRKVRASRRNPFEHKMVEEVKSREEILEIQEPYIIVTTSGMLQGGPVLCYLEGLAGDSSNLIYLTGYQVPGTRGRALLEGIRVLEIGEGRKISVRARVEFADFSAHADQNGLLSLIYRVSGLREVLLFHGEKEKMDDLRRKVERRGLMAYAPRLGERLILR